MPHAREDVASRPDGAPAPRTQARHLPPMKAAIRWILDRVRNAFYSAGSPTSARIAPDAEHPEHDRPARPGGSFLRRME
jgi:hypothetical protein